MQCCITHPVTAADFSINEMAVAQSNIYIEIQQRSSQMLLYIYCGRKFLYTRGYQCYKAGIADQWWRYVVKRNLYA